MICPGVVSGRSVRAGSTAMQNIAGVLALLLV
jgi:hypothetical protein